MINRVSLVTLNTHLILFGLIRKATNLIYSPGGQSNQKFFWVKVYSLRHFSLIFMNINDFEGIICRTYATGYHSRVKNKNKVFPTYLPYLLGNVPVNKHYFLDYVPSKILKIWFQSIIPNSNVFFLYQNLESIDQKSFQYNYNFGIS